ncbi:MAG: hypothetical protein PWR13_480 [Archaeoglobi archaeon]|nr:hypothetical protein [Archaeoglobi archaeon]
MRVNWKDNLYAVFVLMFLISLVVQAFLDYLRYSSMDFESVLIKSLGVAVGWSVAWYIINRKMMIES